MLTTFVTLFVTMMLLAAAPAGAADKAVMSTPEHIVYYCAGQAGIASAPGTKIAPEQMRRLLWCVENNKHLIKTK